MTKFIDTSCSFLSVQEDQPTLMMPSRVRELVNMWDMLRATVRVSTIQTFLIVMQLLHLHVTCKIKSTTLLHRWCPWPKCWSNHPILQLNIITVQTTEIFVLSVIALNIDKMLARGTVPTLVYQLRNVKCVRNFGLVVADCALQSPSYIDIWGSLKKISHWARLTPRPIWFFSRTPYISVLPL